MQIEFNYANCFNVRNCNSSPDVYIGLHNICYFKTLKGTLIKIIFIIVSVCFSCTLI